MTKQLMTACPLAVSLILVCGFALADPGQEQACAGRVAEMRNIPMSDIRATKIEGSESGMATVDFDLPGRFGHLLGGPGEYNIHDMHFSRHPERQRRSSSSNKDATGDTNAQEQACASRMAGRSERAHEFGSRDPVERVHHGEPPGHHVYTGMKALCTADIHNNVVFSSSCHPIESTGCKSSLRHSATPIQKFSGQAVGLCTLRPEGRQPAGHHPQLRASGSTRAIWMCGRRSCTSPIWPRPNSVTVGSRPICKGSATSAW
jgi:hypothetical protein